MFSINQCKLQAKQQLKGNTGPLMNASLIMFAISAMLALTNSRISQVMPFMTFSFRVIQFCITSILGFALTYLAMKLVKTRTSSFTDYQIGLTKIKPALLGNLWHTLFLTLWKLIFIVPISIIISIPFSIAIFNVLDLGNIDWTTVDPNRFAPENFNIEEMSQNILNEVQQFFATHYVLAILLGLLFIGLAIITIIKGIQYSQMFMVLAESALENKKVSVPKAMNLSKELTKGKKGKLFVFYLSFIGWISLACLPVFILAILKESHVLESEMLFTTLVSLTVSLGCTLLLPYIRTAFVNVYGFLKEEAVNSGKLNLADFE